MELAADRVVVPTSEWACRMWQNWKWKRTQHTKAKKKKHTEHWAALRHTTEIMQTKQLFDCRPVSVVRRSFLFFFVRRCRHRIVAGVHLDIRVVRLQIVLSHRCQVKRIIHFANVTNQTVRLFSFSSAFFFLFFHSLFYGFLLARHMREERTPCAHEDRRSSFRRLHHWPINATVESRTAAPWNHCSSF